MRYVILILTISTFTTKGFDKMAEMEKKVRSIRADDEVYAKFKEVCEQAGGQNEALSALISSYELETAKGMLPGQATSIDDFVKTIEDLQTRNEQLLADYTALSEQSEQAQIAHQAEITELRSMCDLAQDKALQAEKQREQSEKIANMATEQVEQLKTKVSELMAKASQSDEYKSDRDRLQASETTCKARIGELEKKLVEEQEKSAATIAAAAEMAAQDKASAVKVAVADTKELYQTKIEQMQQAYTAQINALIATINSPTEKK